MAASCLHEKFLHLLDQPDGIYVVYSSFSFSPCGDFSFVFLSIEVFKKVYTCVLCAASHSLSIESRSSLSTALHCSCHTEWLDVQVGGAGPSLRLTVMRGGRVLFSILCEFFLWPNFNPFGLFWSKCIDTHTTRSSKLCIQVDDISDSEGRGDHTRDENYFLSLKLLVKIFK